VGRGAAEGRVEVVERAVGERRDLEVDAAVAQQLSLGERLYGQLQDAGVDVLLDDRSERAGVKFKDADLIGIPWRVVVGRGAASGQVELVERCNGDKRELDAEALLTTLMPSLESQRRGLAA